MSAFSSTPGSRLIDSLTAKTVKALSLVVGVKNITWKFWNRWRASLIGEETIMEFLGSIGSLEDWLPAGMRIVERERAELEINEHSLTAEEKVRRLRRLSYLCHMVQWGSVEISEGKRSAYRLSRDYYIQAEQLAHGNRYRRIRIRWQGKDFWGNLHLPKERTGLFPLVLILHGMDDSKEEHLMTELMGQESSAVFCFDGPGQAEALYLDGWTWVPNFHEFVSHTITLLCQEHECDPARVGLSGISWGGMWAIRTAAYDARVRGVWDLGGPIEWLNWYGKLPYVLKSRFCQVLGATTIEDIRGYHDAFSIDNVSLLQSIRCPVRVIHGAKDPILDLRHKQWLVDTLKSLHPEQEISFLIHPRGDHCCTGEAAAVRADAAAFFERVLGIRRQTLSC